MNITGILFGNPAIYIEIPRDYSIREGGDFFYLTFNEQLYMRGLVHTFSHILANATVLRLWIFKEMDRSISIPTPFAITLVN